MVNFLLRMKHSLPKEFEHCRQEGTPMQPLEKISKLTWDPLRSFPRFWMPTFYFASLEEV
jgi:hypothetical protein